MPPNESATPSQLAARFARLEWLARRDPRRAGRVAMRRLASARNADALFACGWALARWERIALARPALERAQALYAAGGQAAAARRCELALLSARQTMGVGAAHQDAWQALLERCAETEDWAVAAPARCEQIAHLNVLGRHAAALVLAEQAAALIDQHAPPAVQARYAHVAGVAAAGCGDLARGEQLLHRALAQYAMLGQPSDQARVRFELAWLWQRQERFGQARAELEQALATFEAFDMPLRVAFCWKDLGTVAGCVGDYPTAIAYAVRAREQFARCERHDMAARCGLNLGVVAHYSGLFEIARAAYRQAESFYTELGDQRLALICGRNQALALCAEGQAAEALALLDALQPAAQAAGDRLECAEILLVRARAEHQLGLPASLRTLETAQNEFRACGNPAAAAKCQLDQGWQHAAAGRWAAAEACFAAAQPELADRPAHRWRIRHGLGRTAEQRAEYAAALAHYYAAGADVATLRQGLASEHASSGIFAQAAQLYADGLSLAAQQNDAAMVLAFAEQQRALVLQQQIAACAAPLPPEQAERREQARLHLRNALAASDGAVALDHAMHTYLDALLQTRHLAPVAPPNLATFDLGALRATLRAAYANDWTVLAPMEREHELLLAIITPDSLALAHVPLDATLRAALAAACQPRQRMFVYRDLARLRGTPARSWDALCTLGERLLPPELCARLHPGHRLLIAPHGALHALPWAALRTGAGWLCEHAVIELLPTLALRPLPTRQPGPRSPALLLGCGSFGGRAADLPGVATSLDRAAAHWPGPATRLEGAHATRQALLALGQHGALAEYELIHISSHAQLGAAGGLLGHIKLYDDDVWVDDLLRLRLNATLVMLTACEGAAGEVLPGDEVLGVSRALLAAGAARVIASLWPIYDRAVEHVLEALYAAYAAHGDAALALAQAQRALITNTYGTPEMAILNTPFTWASLVATSVGVAANAPAGGTRPAGASNGAALAAAAAAVTGVAG